MYNLFLDDIRKPKDIYKDDYEWQIVRTYDDFVDYIEENGLPKFVSFDHDLTIEHYCVSDGYLNNQYEDETGYDCLVWLCEYVKEHKLKLPKMKFHTASKGAFKYMNKYYAEFIKNHPELI